MSPLTLSSYFGDAFRGFYSLWQEDILCDVTITVGGTNIDSHKLILMASSEYFRKSLMERTLSHISIDHPACSNPDTLKTLMTYLYTGTLALSVINIQDLLAASKYLQISSAVDLCKNFSCSNSDIRLSKEHDGPPQSFCAHNSQSNCTSASDHHGGTQCHDPMNNMSPTRDLYSDHPTMVEHQPSNNMNPTKDLYSEHHPTVVEHQSTVVEHQSTMVEYQSTVVEHQSTVVEHQPAMVEPEQFNIHREHAGEIPPGNLEDRKITEYDSGSCPRKKHSCQDTRIEGKERKGNWVINGENELKGEVKTGIMTRLRKRSAPKNDDVTKLSESIEDHISMEDSSTAPLTTCDIVENEDNQDGKTKGVKCSICDRIVSNLRTHIIECRNNRKSDYGHKKCRICQQMFASPEELKSHNKVVHNPRARCRCTICGHGFRSALLVASHMHSKHQIPFDDKFKIYKCQRQFRRCLMKQPHNQGGNCESVCTTRDQDYTFDLLCDFVTVEERRLVCHMAGVHSSHRGFTCDICGKGFKQQSTLIVHRKIHSNAKPHACPECGKKFTQSGGKVRHMRDQHTKEASILCHLCPFVCSEKYVLSRHLYKEHSVPLPEDFVRYQCEFCPYLTFSKEACTAHVNAHTGIRQHECEICQKRFTSKNALRSHMFCHQERQHKCTYPDCLYASSHRNCLKQHILLKHEEIGRKPFSCIMCKYKTALKGNLDKHMRRIHRTENKRKFAKLSQIYQGDVIMMTESDAISANQTVEREISGNQTVEHEIVLQEVTSYEGEETHGITIITMDTLGRIMNAELNSENTTCNIVLQTHVSDELSTNICITKDIEQGIEIDQ